MWVLLHEIGHHLCDINNCKCLHDPVLSETHATLFALKIMCNEGYVRSLVEYMYNIAAAIYRKAGEPHYSAYKKVILKNTWIECGSKLMSEGYPKNLIIM